MNGKTVLRVGGLLLVGALAAVGLGKVRYERNVGRRVDALLAAADDDVGRVDKDDLAGLPDPVRRYLDSALTDGRSQIRTVRLVQRGQFRLGGFDAPWKPLTATEYFTVNPPGVVWDGTIDVAPLVRVRVVDEYVDGEGGLHARLLSTVPVADGTTGPELDEGELLRYLAEAVWFPTAYLPGNGVEWAHVDDSTATATLSHGGTTVSLDFHFNERDEVERVHADSRYRTVDGEYEPTAWTGYFSNYQTRDGVRIPIDGEVEWNLPEGDLGYWRASIDEIEYDTNA